MDLKNIPHRLAELVSEEKEVGLHRSRFPNTPVETTKFVRARPGKLVGDSVNCESQVSFRGGVLFGSAPNRIIIAYEQQRVWREIWMDGRALPKQVDAPGAPESRYYVHSVGRWDADHTLVIDTTGVDDRPWLDEDGYPRRSSALIQERYKRVDQYNTQLTVTVDDPKFYTKPFQFMKANLYWMKDQMFAETFCIPSEGIQYRDSITAPSGIKVLQ